MERLRIWVKNMETKQQIRKRHLSQRNAVSEERVLASSRQISQRLQEYFQKQRAAGNICIYGYYPCGKEVSLLPLYDWLLDQKIPLAFPRVSGEHMEFYQVHSMQDFKEGAFHIMEPVEKCRLAEFEHVFCLVPGSVFDRGGNRYGYGKGYYDRYFSRHKNLYRIGIAYEIQVEMQIPTECCDVNMHALAMENGILFLEEESIWN